MGIYAIGMTGVRLRHVSTCVWVVEAVSDAEARGMAFTEACERWPQKDGYQYLFSVAPVPNEMIERERKLRAVK